MTYGGSVVFVVIDGLKPIEPTIYAMRIEKNGVLIFREKQFFKGFPRTSANIFLECLWEVRRK